MESRIEYSPVRQNQRFKAMERALILIDQGPESLPYHIMDISEGGLSFRYLGQKLKRSNILKISLYHEYDLIVDDLPIQSISDYRMRDSIVPVRRGSVRFAELDNEKLKALQHFIRCFTEAPLPLASPMASAS